MADTNFSSIATSGAIAAGGAISATGALSGASLSLTTPLTKANANESLKRVFIHVDFPNTLADGTTYKRILPFGRAATIKRISIAANVKMVGGTNTLALAKKQGGTSVNLLSTATVDPTAVPAAADTAENLTLTSTAADLVFAAGDCFIATLVCGTMTTDGQNYALVIELEEADA